jgi:hypothetical protein
MTVKINRGSTEPVFASYIERAKYKKALEKEARDAENDRQHPPAPARKSSLAEQEAAIKYFFDHYVGPGELT